MDIRTTMSGRGNSPVKWEQEKLFRDEGPFFHVYSSPLENALLYNDDAERNLAVLYIAVAADAARVDVLAFVLMSNHFHFILKGSKTACLEFFGRLKHRLETYYGRHGRPGLLRTMQCGMTLIGSVKQFRDELTYVLRNPFVARNDVNPFLYPWGSNMLYFNPGIAAIRTEPVLSMGTHALRSFARTRNSGVPASLTMADGRIFPGSFVHYTLVENLFDNARQFVFWIMKNVEAQVEVALRMGETPSLSDEELLPVCLRICRDLSGQTRMADLTQEQLSLLVKRLKYDYYASNGQIARMTGLPLESVNACFPLSAKPFV